MFPRPTRSACAICSAAMRSTNSWRASSRRARRFPPRRPVLIKIAPDLDLRGLDDIVEVATSRGADGLIVSNTTIARPSTLRHPRSRETGGLSGWPLFPGSTQLSARAYLRCEGVLTLIGCGGIEDWATALAKIQGGATLLQLYTSFVYRGPQVIDDILDGLSVAVSTSGVPIDRLARRNRGPGFRGGDVRAARSAAW